MDSMDEANRAVDPSTQLQVERLDVPIASINASDDRFQLRHSTATKSLITSMAEVGQISPVTLWVPPVGDAKPIIVDGFQRVEASIALGRDYVKAQMFAGDESEAYQRAYVENVVRRNLKPLERSAAICNVSEKHGRHAALELFGLSEKQLCRYLELLDLPQPTRDALHQEQISMAHALVIGKYLTKLDQDESELLKLAQRCSVAELDEALKKMQRKRAKPKKFMLRSGETLRVYAFRYNRQTAGSRERAELIKTLQRAIEFVSDSSIADLN